MRESWTKMRSKQLAARSGCPDLCWKTTTREGCRQYFCDARTCGACPRRSETIELSFAKAKVNPGLRYALKLGFRNMREQGFLTAAVQIIKRPVASFLLAFAHTNPCILFECRGLSVV